MKVLNFNSAYPSDGKSVLIRLIANDLKNISKKILILDNSEQVYSGFKRMYDLEEVAGIDAMRPFIKGNCLEEQQIQEIIINLDSNIDYIANSEIDVMEEDDIFFLLKLLEKQYDYVVIEGQKVLKSSEFDINNYYITRPCEKTLKNVKKLSENYRIIVNKEFEELNMNYKKLGIFPFSYDKEIVLMENGYNFRLNNKTQTQLKALTDDILGFKNDIFEDENSEKGSKKKSSIVSKLNILRR